MSRVSPCVMVCVTEQMRCENLIKSGRKLADELGVDLEVLNIQPIRNITVKQSEELQYLFDVVKANHAGMTVYYNDEAALIAAGHSRKCNAIAMVTGLPNSNGSPFIEMVRTLMPDVPMHLTEDNGRIHTLQALINA